MCSSDLPTVLGILHDLKGYNWSFVVAALSSGVAFVLFFLAGPLVAFDARSRATDAEPVGGVASAV